MIVLDDINARILDYLAGRIEGKLLVTFIDDVVSSDDVYEYDSDVQDVVLEYQNILAHYVEDPIMRSEHPSFYGPERLKSVVVDMQRALSG
jgi:hypothetical protein